MKKRRERIYWILISLIIILVIIGTVILIENIQLKKERRNLQDNLEKLMKDRNLAFADVEKCQEDKDKLIIELSMLTDDISNIMTECKKENACKEHYPNIRWICDEEGNASDEENKICFCDKNCNLQFS